MIALDASVLIGWLDPDDAHHARATRFLDLAVEDQLLVHLLTLAEVLVGPSRAARAESVHAALTEIGVTVAPQHPQESLLIAGWRARTGLNLPDCCVLHVASEHGCSLATFDGQLAGAAGRVGIEDALGRT